MMQRSRRQILDFLKLKGEATLEELAHEIGLVPVTVRSHLLLLERENLIMNTEVRGKVGRPRHVFSLTPTADRLFPQTASVVANRVLCCLSGIMAPDQLDDLFRQVSGCWADEHKGRMADKSLEERVAEAARIRTEEGAVATWDKSGDEFFLAQHHCPCRSLAENHRVVCRTEQAYLSQLLDADVERISYQLDGQRTCTYRIRPRSANGHDGFDPSTSGSHSLT